MLLMVCVLNPFQLITMIVVTGTLPHGLERMVRRIRVWVLCDVWVKPLYSGLNFSCYLFHSNSSCIQVRIDDNLIFPQYIKYLLYRI